MISLLSIYLCISIQIIFGFTFITDEEIIKQTGKQSFNLALSGKRDDFTMRQEDKNDEETNRLMLGISQYDRNPVGDLLVGSDNFLSSQLDNGDNIGSIGKFEVGFRLIKLGKRRNSIIGTSQWGRRKRRLRGIFR